jgi:hypothetical protein
MNAEVAKHPIRITKYSFGVSDVHVWTEKDVSGTWVIGTIAALRRGVPFAKSFGATFTLHHEASADIP